MGETDRQLQTLERGAKGLRGRWNSGGHRKIHHVSAAVSLGGHPSQALPVRQSVWSWVLTCLKDDSQVHMETHSPRGYLMADLAASRTAAPPPRSLLPLPLSHSPLHSAPLPASPSQMGTSV